MPRHKIKIICTSPRTAHSRPGQSAHPAIPMPHPTKGTRPVRTNDYDDDDDGDDFPPKALLSIPTPPAPCPNPALTRAWPCLAPGGTPTVSGLFHKRRAGSHTHRSPNTRSKSRPPNSTTRPFTICPPAHAQESGLLGCYTLVGGSVAAILAWRSFIQDDFHGTGSKTCPLREGQALSPPDPFYPQYREYGLTREQRQP
jgi:hypothetical protein